MDREEELEEALLAVRGALIWTTGSGDFSPGGKARRGYLRTVRPALHTADAALKGLKEKE